MPKSKTVKKNRKSFYDSGTGSEFLVLSMLYRLNVNAFISLGNKKAIDIIIKAKNGQALSIDVKSVRDYSSVPINNVKKAINHFIVVVIYNKKFDDPTTLPEFFIIPSDKIPELNQKFGNEVRLLKGKISSYKDQWKQLQV